MKEEGKSVQTPVLPKILFFVLNLGLGL
jgi:hypothetical protein